jgi:hypothetical protein
MKKLLALLLLGLFLSGCGAAARESEFWQHDSVYKNWDHLRYSWWGYKNPNQASGEKSIEQGWWGIEIPYIPAE